MEFLHFSTQIVNIAIAYKDLRTVVLTEALKAESQDDSEGKPFTYAYFLKQQVEKLPEVLSIRKLHARIQRQRKELEFWANAKWCKY